MDHSSDPRQATLDLDGGEQRRDQGAQQALDAAHTGARLAGEEAIRQLARSGKPFTAEDVREIVGAPLGCRPAVMGPLFSAARSRGEIVAVGFTTSRRPERHAGVCRIWRGAA